jgi:hypothetical protein
MVAFKKNIAQLVLLSLMVCTVCNPICAENKYSIPELVKKCGPSVVMIFNQEGDKITGTGSGFVIDSKGTIVTNYHVVKDASSISIKLKTGEVFKVTGIINLDKTKDICILKIAGFDLPSLPLGNSNKIITGENCIAIGNPQGFENTVSNGIISGIRSMDGMNLIQITTPISPGSSGGPLLNEIGEVIGITSMTWSESGTQNINFAIPINYVRGLIESPGTFTFNDLKHIDSLENKTFGNNEHTKNANRFKFICKNNDLGEIYLDTQSIKFYCNRKSGIKYVDFWTMWTYSEKGINYLINSFNIGITSRKKWRSLNFELSHDCISSEGKMCRIEYIYYSKDSSIIDSYSYSSFEWKPIIPKSIGETAFTKIYTYALENLDFIEMN